MLWAGKRPCSDAAGTAKPLETEHSGPRGALRESLSAAELKAGKGRIERSDLRRAVHDASEAGA